MTGVHLALADPYFARLLAGVETATHAIGYNLQLVVPRRDQRAIVRGVEQLRERRFEALVIPHVNDKPYNTVVLQRAPDLPIVVVQPPVATELPAVVFDQDAAMRSIVEHLAELGHRRLLWLSGVTDGSVPAGSREQALRTAADAAGLAVESIHYTGPSIQESDHSSLVATRAREVLASHLSERGRPDFTAVVAFNDVGALAACDVLQQRNLRVPQDVSVVGCDNLPPAQTLMPLTTVDHRLADQACRATEIALEMAQEGEGGPRRYRGHREVLEPVLVVRRSTGPASAPQ
jgi:LacI family transcriptional regulator